MAKLHYYYSAMNAGKSTTLLQSSYNYIERGMDTLLYTPMVDDRYGSGKIGSRIGLQSNAQTINNEFDIFADVKRKLAENSNIKCVLIDEAQFLTKEQIRMLCDVCDIIKLPVLAYGLRTDFLGEPFPGSLYLLAWADILIELKTICHCGSKATMNMRIDENGNQLSQGEQVLIGGNESYISTCRKHFHLGESQRIENKLETVC